MGLFLPHVGHGDRTGCAWLSRRTTRTVTVHDLDEARAAVAAAARAGEAVTLVSAPAAAAAGGPQWFKALVEAAQADRPDVAIQSVLDCWSRPADALAALRSGWRTIVYSGPAAGKIRQIAAATNAVVLRKRP